MRFDPVASIGCLSCVDHEPDRSQTARRSHRMNMSPFKLIWMMRATCAGVAELGLFIDGGGAPELQLQSWNGARREAIEDVWRARRSAPLVSRRRCSTSASPCTLPGLTWSKCSTSMGSTRRSSRQPAGGGEPLVIAGEDVNLGLPCGRGAGINGLAGRRAGHASPTAHSCETRPGRAGCIAATNGASGRDGSIACTGSRTLCRLQSSRAWHWWAAAYNGADRWQPPRVRATCRP